MKKRAGNRRTNSGVTRKRQQPQQQPLCVGGAANEEVDANEGDSGSFPSVGELQTQQAKLGRCPPGSSSTSGNVRHQPKTGVFSPKL